MIDNSSSFRSADRIFESRNGEPCAHTAFLIHKLASSCFECDLFYQSLDKVTDFHDCFLFIINLGLLFSDGECGIKIFWIMCQYLAFDTILQWRNDGAPVCIIFRVGGEHKQDIKW